MVEPDLVTARSHSRRGRLVGWLACGYDPPMSIVKRFFALGLAAPLLCTLTACLPPMDYKAENQFQNDMAGQHNSCVLQARQACEGSEDVDSCVANHASSCVGRVASTPDPYRQSILPSGVDDSLSIEMGGGNFVAVFAFERIRGDLFCRYFWT